MASLSVDRSSKQIDPLFQIGSTQNDAFYASQRKVIDPSAAGIKGKEFQMNESESILK